MGKVKLSWAKQVETPDGLEIIAGGYATCGPRFEPRQVVDFRARVRGEKLEVVDPIAFIIEFDGDVPGFIQRLLDGPAMPILGDP